MVSRVLFASTIGAALLLGAAVAQAGGCKGSSCYTLVETPPVYGSVSETYVARPAQTYSRVVPAVYDYVTEQVMLHPGRTIPHHRSAQYSTVQDKVLISPATKRWDVSRDAYGNTTGCWVHVPAQYGYQQRTVEIAPASVDYETTAPVYAQRQRKVMVRPTQVLHETTPALYETRERKVLVQPPSRQWQRAGF